MKFFDKITIRSQDVDMHGCIRPSALLGILEDLGLRQMAAYPPSADDLRKNGMAFISSRIVLEVKKDIKEGLECDIETWATDSRGVSFNRCYRLLSGGQVYATVYSIWALLNFNENKLVRVGENGHLGGEANPPELPSIPLRVRMPSSDEYEEVAKRKVYYSDVDMNGHFNNARYLNMLCDFVPDIHSKRLRGINISYVNEAPFNDCLTVLRHTDGDMCYFKTLRADGKVNCEAVLYF